MAGGTPGLLADEGWLSAGLGGLTRTSVDSALQQGETGNCALGKRQWCAQQMRTMAPRLHHNVRHLEALEINALRVIWRRTFRSAPPSAARKEFLVRILAYAAQEQAHRALSKPCAKILREYECTKFRSGTPAGPQQDLPPGARLIRQWGGSDHEVMVMERGYAYRGTSYSSLSEIARHITGARWSGPRFFGLKKKAGAAVPDEGA